MDERCTTEKGKRGMENPILVRQLGEVQYKSLLTEACFESLPSRGLVFLREFDEFVVQCSCQILCCSTVTCVTDDFLFSVCLTLFDLIIEFEQQQL